jgi:hypothetical protein
MASTGTLQVQLSANHLGLARIEEIPTSSLKTANELLQKNHEEWDIFFSLFSKEIPGQPTGHNHIAHSLLSVLAMGGGPEQLIRAYEDSETLRRPVPALELQTAKKFSDPEKFLQNTVKRSEYTNFLVFFEKEIAAKGWQAVINEYLFSRTPVAEALFAQLYEGLYHPIIHLGFGVEFYQPSIVAEGLAQAASHEPGHVWTPFFTRSEQLAQSASVQATPLADLYAEVRANAHIRASAHIQDGPFRGQRLIERAVDELVPIAAKFKISPNDIERAMAEIYSTSAFTTCAQKPGKQRKIDFFYLHLVTSSISIDAMIREPWIKIEDKVRLLEWKGRIDLAWYASNGSPELRAETITDYKATLSNGFDWKDLYRAANDIHDDGHIVKFIRAMKNGEDIIKPYEQQTQRNLLPVRGDMWFKMAQIMYDSTVNVVDEADRLLSQKWVWGAGFDLAWNAIPDDTK